MIRPYSHTKGRLEIVSNYLLLVEGKDEVNLFTSLIQSRFADIDCETKVQIEEVGKETFRKRFGAIVKAARKTASLKAIGIVRDADENAAGALASVCDSVSSFDCRPPDSHGTFSASSPAIGVFITPDGMDEGAIESICRRSVGGNTAGQCAEEYLECLRERNALLSTNHDKSFAHAYLAGMRDPVARVGEGALQGVWNFESPAFRELCQFVLDLVLQGDPQG